MFEQELTFAARALAAGNLAASEIVCRDVLDKDARNASALTLLGTIAANIGSPQHAAGYFEGALAADPTNSEARNGLSLLRSGPGQRASEPAAAPKFLLIKSWGYGFWSDVSQVLGSLLLAEVTGRIPVTHWGKNSLFGGGSTVDAFTHYFEPVSKVTLHDLEQMTGASVFPPKWTSSDLAEENVAKWEGPYSRAAALYFLNRSETIAVSDFYIGVIDVAPWIPDHHPMHSEPLQQIYRYLVNKYLRPTSAVLAACDAFFRTHLEGAPYLALHIRGSDKMLEDKDLEASCEMLLSAVRSADATWPIFLLTDDVRWCERVKDEFGSRVITTDSQRTSTTTGVHYLPSADRLQVGREVLIDSLLAARADRFVGNGRSNVAGMIALMKDWRPEDCTLLGESLLMQRNLFIHVRR
jgi:protein O-GlcNAc transferase